MPFLKEDDFPDGTPLGEIALIVTAYAVPVLFTLGALGVMRALT